jgi:very-short-patch-repair endonuclease
MKKHALPGAIQRARRLRRDATDAEKRMWRLLRENFPEARFRRQVPLGEYITDFASHRTRVVIEVDGGQHTEGTDTRRTEFISSEGYSVLRFWNNDVLDNPEGVLATIEQALR